METTTEQKKLLRKKLIDRLRNPNEKQTKYDLENASGRCCLGIACRVYFDMFPGDLPITPNAHNTATSFDGHYSGLPEQVQEAFGFIGRLGQYGENNSLANLNDSSYRFTQIADIIESEPEGLFV